MITTSGTWFKDEHGRSLLLRGVNLGGQHQGTFLAQWCHLETRPVFYDHRRVSFCGATLSS